MTALGIGQELTAKTEQTKLKLELVMKLLPYYPVPLAHATAPLSRMEGGEGFPVCSSEGLLAPGPPQGSMESIDEHCKNFATSSWTQFKVGAWMLISNNNPIPKVWASMQRQSLFRKLCRGKNLKAGKFCVHWDPPFIIYFKANIHERYNSYVVNVRVRNTIWFQLGFSSKALRASCS